MTLIFSINGEYVEKEIPKYIVVKAFVQKHSCGCCVVAALRHQMTSLVRQ